MSHNQSPIHSQYKCHTINHRSSRSTNVLQSITNLHSSEYSKPPRRAAIRPGGYVHCGQAFPTCLQVRSAGDPGSKKLACFMHSVEAHLTCRMSSCTFLSECFAQKSGIPSGGRCTENHALVHDLFERVNEGECGLMEFEVNTSKERVK